ncbi:Rv3235 family protein [Streptomyces sp. NPDC096033]|uniref:Rv3235 family protein n=1 Tax=Streptomyces sp. NPDC096033 TaxID=3366071 RepID=UPI003817F7C2
MDTTTRGTVGGEGSRSRPGAPGRTRPAGRRDQRRPGAVPGSAGGVRPGGGPRPPGGSLRSGGAGGAPRRLLPHEWFAQRILAVVSGQRPVHSLLGLTVGEAYDQLVELAPTGPLGERLRPVLRQCGRFHPGPGVIEAFARIATGERVSALAFRLEQGADLRWRCAAVEIRGPRPWGSSRVAVVS